MLLYIRKKEAEQKRKYWRGYKQHQSSSPLIVLECTRRLLRQTYLEELMLREKKLHPGREKKRTGTSGTHLRSLPMCPRAIDDPSDVLSLSCLDLKLPLPSKSGAK